MVLFLSQWICFCHRCMCLSWYMVGAAH
jgi:hypothetical protein